MSYIKEKNTDRKMFFFLFFMLFTYNIIIAQIEPYFK